MLVKLVQARLKKGTITYYIKSSKPLEKRKNRSSLVVTKK